MTITLSEAQALTPGTVVHFGDEDKLYVVVAVGYGYLMPVKVLVERYPEHVDGHQTFFTDLQLDLVTVVGEAKADEADTLDPQPPEGTSPGASPLRTPPGEAPWPSSGTPPTAWGRVGKYSESDPGDQSPRLQEAHDDPADSPLEVPRPQEVGPAEGDQAETDLNDGASTRARRRGKYKGG